MADRDRTIDGKEYARQMRENAVKDENGIVRVSIELWEQIADIIERSIVPPCKIGDKIYMLVIRTTYSFEFPKGKMQRIESQHTFIKETYLTKRNFFKVLEDFGKTVFLTKEDAEAKLKDTQINTKSEDF